MCAGKSLFFDIDPKFMLITTNYGPILDRKCAQCGGWTKLPERAIFKCSYCGSVGKEQKYGRH